MINKISTYLCNLLCKENLINLEDKALYKYGFEITLANIVNAVIVLMIGMIGSSLLEIGLFYFIFVSLRFYCGGYHAKSYSKCFMLFALTCLISLCIGNVITYYQAEEAILAVSLIVQGICIYKMAPIENKNKQLNQEEKTIFKKRCWLVYSFWMVVGMCFILLGLEGLTSAFSAAFILISIFMITEKTGGNNDERKQELAQSIGENL